MYFLQLEEYITITFVNLSDGDQELRCELQLYNSWYDKTVKSYVEADLIDFEVRTLDAANYVFSAAQLEVLISALDHVRAMAVLA